MYYEVIIDNTSFVLSEEHMKIVYETETQPIIAFGTYYPLMGKKSAVVNFDIPMNMYYEDQISLLFHKLTTKFNNVIGSMDSTTYKFDITVQIIKECNWDDCLYNLGNILYAERKINGCYVTNIEYSYDRFKADVQFDEIILVQYF